MVLVTGTYLQGTGKHTEPENGSNLPSTEIGTLIVSVNFLTEQFSGY